MPPRKQRPMLSAEPGETLQELTLYPSRRRWSVVLLGSLLFCAAAPLTIPRNPWMGWLGLVVFGFSAAVSLLFVLFPGVSSLRLTRDGFVQCSLFRTRLTRWQDVTDFSVASISMHAMVVFNYSLSYTGQYTRQLATDLAGWEGALADTYGMDAQELANLMNEWKRRADLKSDD